MQFVNPPLLSPLSLSIVESEALTGLESDATAR